MRHGYAWAFGTLLALAVGFAGGASAAGEPPSSADLERVKGKQFALVLFQLKLSIGGKSIPPLSASDSNNRVLLHLANLGERTAPRRISPASPSEAAAAEGWHYLLLPPGTYYLLALPPGLGQNPPAVAYHAPSAKFGRLTQYKFEPGRGGFWSPELGGFIFAGAPPPDFRELRGYWFDVPNDTSVVYLGTLAVACASGRGLFGNLLDSCSEFDVAADAHSAQQVAATAFPELGALETRPLVPYGKTRDGVRLRERGLLDVSAATSAALGTATIGAQLAPWDVMHGTGRAIGVYNLLAVLAGAASRASAEREADERAAQARPCMAQLAKALPAIDYAAGFAAALADAARAREIPLEVGDRREPAAPGGSGARQHLTVAVPVLHLRESTQAQHLALELGVRVRLSTADAASVVYDGLLLYAEPFPSQNPLTQGPRLYERLVALHPQARPMLEWCGSDGAAILAEEIATGLKRIAEQVVADLE